MPHPHKNRPRKGRRKIGSKRRKARNKKNKRYITEVMTWGVNQAKWKAAEEYCADRKWNFLVLTEHELGIKF